MQRRTGSNSNCINNAKQTEGSRIGRTLPSAMSGAPSEDPHSHQSPPSDERGEDMKKWGTHVMGPPAVPSVHPDNQKAASWTAAGDPQHPYVVYSPVEKPNTNPLDPLMRKFHSCTAKAESLARNIWHNLKTGSSVSEAAWGKVNLTAKAMTEGGFESLFHQIFETHPDEKLKKTFACYLSTATGPVAGTLYLSTARVAFSSDRPLSFYAPSGQQAWSYYKVMIPLANIATLSPVIMRENPSEKYIQVATIDDHDFWFMGFVNFEKASQHLWNTLFEFRAAAGGGGDYAGKPAMA